MSADTGGPAFPVSIPGYGDNGWHGMSLRDWFAGNAMQGIFAAGVPSDFTFADVAEKAYRAADRMLEEARAMIFRVYHETKGGHVHIRLFAGKRDGALGKCGDLCMRVEEFEVFRESAGFVQFRPEPRDEDGLRIESETASPFEQGGISDRLSNFDSWGDRIRERD